MDTRRHTAAAALCAAVSACAPYGPADVAQPSTISLKAALTGVVDALNEARARSEASGVRIGLNPCTVTAVFNVAVKAAAGGGVELGVTAGPPMIPAGVNLGGRVEQTVEGSRGNQVTVTLTSPACLPQGSLGATNPEKIVLAQEQINEARGMAPMGGATSPKPGQ